MLHTHEIDDIADRFRHWLQKTDEDLDDPQVVALAEQLSQRAGDSSQDVDPVGLLQLVESLTAMRHDYKLHAKSLRRLHEDVQASLTGMAHATSELETARTDALHGIEKAATDAAGPLLEALLDIDEALRQATATMKRSAKIDPDDAANKDLLKDVDGMFDELPRWKRWFVRGTWNRLRNRLSRAEDLVKVGGHDAGLFEGLGLLQTRVRRVLAETGVTTLNCVGKRVDPRTMCVVDVVEDAQLPPETVVDEVRVGYLWKDKTIRIAEVRATKSQGGSPVLS